ncbi:hypothetical protein BDZ88DRAFT_442157 [Geranomyces variabilis]|nr:hypothetical protein BDZ88DRAFT_442157 [Geranomyces variabilis]
MVDCSDIFDTSAYSRQMRRRSLSNKGDGLAKFQALQLHVADYWIPRKSQDWKVADFARLYVQRFPESTLRSIRALIISDLTVLQDGITGKGNQRKASALLAGLKNPEGATSQDLESFMSEDSRDVVDYGHRLRRTVAKGRLARLREQKNIVMKADEEPNVKDMFFGQLAVTDHVVVSTKKPRQKRHKTRPDSDDSTTANTVAVSCLASALLCLHEARTGHSIICKGFHKFISGLYSQWTKVGDPTQPPHSALSSCEKCGGSPTFVHWLYHLYIIARIKRGHQRL